MTPEDELEAKKAALQHLKDSNFFDSKEDDPDGLLDTVDEHLQRAIDQHKKDLEDAMNFGNNH